MIDTGLILLAAIHPGVIYIDVRSIVSVKDGADHVVIIINLRKHEYHIRIVLIKPVKFRFQLRMIQIRVIGHFIDKGMALGVQTVVRQKTVQIGKTCLGRLLLQMSAARCKEVPAALLMVVRA